MIDDHGVRSAHVVGGRVPNALLPEVLTHEGLATTILPDTAPHFLADSKRHLKPVAGEAVAP